jgi:hypothetical protein
MDEIEVTTDLVLTVPAGVEFIAPHMTEWAEARPGLLSVHAGDKLRANTPEAAAAIAVARTAALPEEEK